MKQHLMQTRETRAHVYRILVPVNFTDADIRAVEYAAKLARPMGATVTLLHVVEVDRKNNSRAQTRDAVEKKLQNLINLFIGTGLTTEIIIGMGKPDEQILYEIREMNPDIVLMTCRYRKATRWFWQRDTASEVLKRAPCPVSVLHDAGSDLSDLLFY